MKCTTPKNHGTTNQGCGEAYQAEASGSETEAFKPMAEVYRVRGARETKAYVSEMIHQ
jgi:hypothetical protein